MLRHTLALVASIFLTTAGQAQSVAPLDTLFRALGLPETLDVMREEGMAYGRQMQEDMLMGRGGARWPEMVSEIYDVAQMSEILRNRLDEELAAEDLAPMIAFFDSEIGRRIVRLEVSARQTLLDPQIEEASRAHWKSLKEDGAGRLDLITALAEAGDLIENNVVGALNSNYAFYVGLVDGGGTPNDLTEAEILADVWGQEPFIREDTTEWLFAYLTMAYQPLSDAELRAYAEFYESAPGQALNDAIFVAFDDMFTAISRALGYSAAQFLSGEEL